MHKIIYFTNIAPQYRQPLWVRLLSSTEFEMQIYFGKEPGSGFKEIDMNSPLMSKFHSKIHRVRNFWFRKKVLFWQSGIITTCLFGHLNTAIFTGEMYCLSTWLAAIGCRMRRIEVVFWGHGLYGNEGKIKLFIRKLFYRIANKHMLYERRAKSLMVEQGFQLDNLHIFFNSLDYKKHLSFRTKFKNLQKSKVFNFFKNPELPVLVFIGRLTPQKKMNLVVDATNSINKQKTLVNLLIIGNGPEMNNLRHYSQKGISEGWLNFKGELYDEVEAGKLLYCSDLCVSPGNVGLTAIHSLSLGTPVCTHHNFSNQGPEAEAITDELNGFYFEENNSKDLELKILGWINCNINRDDIRHQCYSIIDRYYNPDYQIEVLKNILKNNKPLI